MTDNELAKALFAFPNKVRKIDGEFCLLSEACYNDDNEIIMHGVCPLCNIRHYTPFQYVEGVAQIKCPNTGVKIYAIYA